MRRMSTSRQHGSRCRRYLRLWEQSNRCPTPDLSHLHPLPRHQPLNIMHRSPRKHRPQNRARGHSSRTLIVPKDLPTHSRILAVLTLVRLLLRCHPHHHHPRKRDHRTSHALTRHHSTIRGCHHCTPPRRRSLHRLLLPDQIRHILRTHQRHPRLMSPLHLRQLNLCIINMTTRNHSTHLIRHPPLLQLDHLQHIPLRHRPILHPLVTILPHYVITLRLVLKRRNSTALAWLHMESLSNVIWTASILRRP
jgi:hypothetical protein